MTGPVSMYATCRAWLSHRGWHSLILALPLSTGCTTLQPFADAGRLPSGGEETIIRLAAQDSPLDTSSAGAQTASFSTLLADASWDPNCAAPMTAYPSLPPRPPLDTSRMVTSPASPAAFPEPAYAPTSLGPAAPATTAPSAARPSPAVVPTPPAPPPPALPPLTARQPETVGVVRLGGTAIQEAAVANPVVLTGHDGQVRFAPTTGYAQREGIVPISHIASPRVGGPCGPGCPCPSCGPGGSIAIHIGGAGVMAWDPTHYPDEYLCDGGDRGLPFHYMGRHVGGLETEDTIAEAYDITGKRVTIPSSQVCIYAPRFGALRTMTGTYTARDSSRAAGTHDHNRVAGLNAKLKLDEQVQQSRLEQFRVRSRASSSEANSQDALLNQQTVAQTGSQMFAAFQNLTFVTEGQFQQSDLPILSYGVQAAGTWTRDHNPIMVGSDVRGQQVEVKFNAAEVVGVEDKRSPALLRVVKLADRESAHQGDIIKFTIRFDNLGQRELRHIKIIDNLTPRLEYVSGSATCELPGDLEIEPNREGSSILTFKLDEPLGGETGGVISFECRVR